MVRLREEEACSGGLAMLRVEREDGEMERWRYERRREVWILGIV